MSVVNVNAPWPASLFHCGCPSVCGVLRAFQAHLLRIVNGESCKTFGTRLVLGMAELPCGSEVANAYIQHEFAIRFIMCMGGNWDW